MGSKQTSKNCKSAQVESNVVNFGGFQKKNSVAILPRNLNQENYTLSLLDKNKNIVFGVGPAGTGKTMLAVQVAIKMFKNKEIDKIIVTRPAVSVDEEIGHLPGTLEEKMAPWTIPIFDVFREYFNAAEIEGMLKEKIIEVAPLGFMRGRTFKNSYIVADECQLTTPNQMKMLLTRLGEGSYMAVTGDLKQADRGNDNGLIDFLHLVNHNESSFIDVIHFTPKDVERHEAVKDVLRIYGEE